MSAGHPAQESGGRLSTAPHMTPWPWGPFQPGDGEPVEWRAGDLGLWCLRDGAEIRLGSRLLTGAASDDTLPRAIGWERFSVQGAEQGLQMHPVLPARAFVARCESVIQLRPHSELTLYVRLPLWVSVRLASDESSALTELPTTTLRRSWYGSFTAGELCYAIHTSARTRPEPDPARPYLALCPVRISNSTETELRLERILLQAPLLGLYRHHDQLWTDELVLGSLGSSGDCEQVLGGGAPAEVREARLISPPRQVAGGSLLGRAMLSLREFPEVFKTRRGHVGGGTGGAA